MENLMNSMEPEPFFTGTPAPLPSSSSSLVPTASLKGNLETFPLQDLLGLISQQKRSGILHLTKGADDAVDMTFREGMLIKAKKSRPKARELFGNLLVEAKLVTEQQRSRAVDEQRRTLKQLGEILVDMGALTRENLRDFVHLQTMEAVYLPFEWGNEGEWEFVEIEQEPDFEGVLPIDCASIIREGLSRQASWPSLRRRFKTKQITFRRVKEFPQPGSSVLAKAQKRGHILGARERRIYALAEPDVSLGTIISLSKIGEFETTSALDDLYDAGLIRFGSIQGSHVSGTSFTSGKSVFEQLRTNKKSVVFAFVTVALVVLAVWRGKVMYDGQTYEAGDIGPKEGSLVFQELLESAQRRRISAALEVHRIRTGKLPGTLEELVDLGLLMPRDLTYPFRKSYIYRPQKDGTYLLLPPLE